MCADGTVEVPSSTYYFRTVASATVGGAPTFIPCDFLIFTGVDATVNTAATP